MRKRRFIGRVSRNTGIVEGDEFHHLVNVLRGKKGTEFILIARDGKGYEAVIEKIDRKKRIVLARLCRLLENKETPEIDGVIVAFALFSENRLKFLLEKCTEIGVKGFLPFVAERSKRKNAALREGWKKVIESAVKQSERMDFPVIEEVEDLTSTIDKAERLGDIYLLDVRGTEVDEVVLRERNQVIFVGPEGGFTEREKEMIKDKARGIVSLGGNVLRTETAAIVGSYEFLKKIKTKGGEALVRSPFT